MKNWVDITTIDNNTPFYDVAWSFSAVTDSEISNGDRWFAERPGLVTDNMGAWEGGPIEMGRYGLHRFNCITGEYVRNYMYCCNFDETNTDPIFIPNCGYTISVVDAAINTLPNVETISGIPCYCLGLREWVNWKPLYGAYSGMSTMFEPGNIFVQLASSGATNKNIADIRIGNEFTQKVYLGNDVIYEASGQSHDYSTDYLTFEVLSAGTIMWMAENKYGGEPKYLSYSINGGPWITIYSSTAGTPINVEAGDEVRVKANGIEGSEIADMRSSFKGSTSYFNLRGNIASMVDENNYQNLTVFENKSRVRYLFQGTNVVDASKLILPFTVFKKNNAYYSLFAGCKKLISAPEIPAAFFQDVDTQTDSIYSNMFQNCTSLTRAPKLPTRTLCNYCYYNMFNGCTSLNYVECLADTTTGYNPFVNWLNGVAATGTFVKHPDANWSSGTSGIPNGWTVVDYVAPNP